jgi:hypothetical protein
MRAFRTFRRPTRLARLKRRARDRGYFMKRGPSLDVAPRYFVYSSALFSERASEITLHLATLDQIEAWLNQADREEAKRYAHLA